VGERGATVLLVDDDQKLRTLLHRVLEGAGYRVCAAACGEEAIAIYDRNRAALSLIITDIQMPGLLGPELVDELSRQGCVLPVLYISGFYGENAFDRRQLATGRSVQFLRKPFMPAVLVAKVGEMLSTSGRKPPGEAGPESQAQTA
jgi:CheY-like chemotaxis protein